MTSLGKKSRLNRAGLRRARHTHKSPDKRRRMGWTRSGALKHAA